MQVVRKTKEEARREEAKLSSGVWVIVTLQELCCLFILKIPSQFHNRHTAKSIVMMGLIGDKSAAEFLWLFLRWIGPGLTLMSCRAPGSDHCGTISLACTRIRLALDTLHYVNVFNTTLHYRRHTVERWVGVANVIMLLFWSRHLGRERVSLAGGVTVFQLQTRTRRVALKLMETDVDFFFYSPLQLWGEHL